MTDAKKFNDQIELLGSRTRLILAERQKFVHIGQGRTEEIMEIRELLFSLGPLSAYLFQVFSEAMLSPLTTMVRSVSASASISRFHSTRLSAVPEPRSSPSSDIEVMITQMAMGTDTTTAPRADPLVTWRVYV